MCCIAYVCADVRGGAGPAGSLIKSTESYEAQLESCTPAMCNNITVDLHVCMCVCATVHVRCDRHKYYLVYVHTEREKVGHSTIKRDAFNYGHVL